MKLASGTTLIDNGQLFDGTGAPPVPNAAVVIRDGRIANLAILHCQLERRSPDHIAKWQRQLDRDKIAHARLGSFGLTIQ